MAYTNIDDPSAHFYSYAFSKSAGTGSVTFDANSDLKPDFLWVKSRSNADGHELWDSTRGVNSTLFSHATEAEDTAANRIVSFDTDGFTWGNAGNLNAAGTFVSWAWKANGGTTSSNTDGTITTTIQTNSDAGFSICRHDGNGTAGATFGHGLGVKPSFIISKRTDSITNWRCYHSSLGATKHILLNTTGASVTATDTWNNTEPTSSVVTVGNSSRTNASGSAILFYVFAEKQGFSKFGEYIGNGNLNGPFVYTGFKPAFVIVKQRNTARPWQLFDNKRDGYNENQMPRLQPNDSAAEVQDAGASIDLLSNGFKVRSNQTGANQSGGTYIYMAFAENPFVTSTGIPTTAR